MRFKSFSPLYPTIITLVVFCALIKPLTAQGQVVINEIMSANVSTMADEDGDYEDWVELYNFGDSIIRLEGIGLSDDTLQPYRWIFPNISLLPQQYLLVWASGKNRTALPSQHQVLIPEKSDWKYRDDGSDLGSLWHNGDFDDSSWNSGTAMLGYDTNNGTLFGTEISFGNNAGYKHLTYYFRKSFEIDDVAKYDSLQLTLMIDDGAVVYLNGQEIVRQNMPAGAITYATQASIIVGDLDVSVHSIDASVLINGLNTLAVEMHQGSRTSSDLRFDLQLLHKGRYLHTDFSISSGGEELYLTHPTLGTLDSVPPQQLPADISMGRWPNGTGAFSYYTIASPGEPNAEERYTELLQPPVFSHAAGFYSNPFHLSITSTQPDVMIWYTLDGSDPIPGNPEGNTFLYKNSFPGEFLSATHQSLLYEGEIYIEDRTPHMEYLAGFASDFFGARYTSPTIRLFKGTVIRAIAVKEGAISSAEQIRSYFVHADAYNRYSFPVISLTTQADNLFGYSDGIYTPGQVWEEQGNGVRDGGAPANYNRRDPIWEKQAYLEYFEKGDTTNPVLSQRIAIRTHGAWSRSHPMKSLRLYARNSYGEEYFNHQIFPDLPYQRYKRLLLRNSGNDYGRTHFLDAAAHEVYKGMHADIQAYQPVVVFINGEYWGIHNARERYDKYYLNRVYGVEENNIDYLEILSGQAVEGDMQHYNNMINYLQNNNIAINTHYKHIQTLMDIESFIDFQIAHIYIANTDWPGNNNDFWRKRTSSYLPYAPYGHDGRWRWLIFDVDFGFGAMNDAYHNTLNHATSPTLIWQNPPASTLMLRRLLLNLHFRNDFINRSADLLNTQFTHQRVNKIINQMENQLEPEMPEHIQRWRRPGSMNNWHNEVNRMNSFANLRPAQLRQHIQNHFNLNGLINFRADVSDPTHGHVRVNTIHISPDTPGVADQPYPWSGIYFQGIPIELEAVSKPGYIFSHWEGVDDISSPILSQSFTHSNVSVKANFLSSNLSQGWHFNTLPDEPVEFIQTDLAHDQVGLISYPGEGIGFMDRYTDGTSLNIIDATPAGFGLRVRNPSATRYLLMETPTTGLKNIALSFATMRSVNGATLQEIQYRTSAGGTWNALGEPVAVTEEWAVHRLNFPSAQVNDNPHFAIRILFKGQQAENEDGNNRFDNIRIEGLDMTTGINPNPSVLEDELHEEFRIWHAEGALNLYNPYHGEALLQLYGINGSLTGEFILNGKGSHTLQTMPGYGIFIARLRAAEGVSTERFLVKE